MTRTRVVTPSNKPISREQTGKLCDKLFLPLVRSSIEGPLLQMVLESATRSDAMIRQIVEVVRTHAEQVIHIDRNARPRYPRYFGKAVDPILDDFGPTDYRLDDVESWRHPKQNGRQEVTGEEVYAEIKRADDLKRQLDLRDLHAIRQFGPEVFDRYFGSSPAFGWKSVLSTEEGCLYVPYLLRQGGAVAVFWSQLDVFLSNHRALRFRNGV